MANAGAAKAEAPPMKVYGFCWFKRDQYVAARAMMIDPQDLFDTYDEWLHEARAIEAKAQSEGVRVMRIRFDPVSFAWFCRVQGILPDNQARAAWAASEAKERYDGKK
ncbi:hypothetical protein [Methyloraptor flagellatus]|uniref:Uncharacterized protein n=1 Tax=Methyloraptor flagellatus TaxID=3162530 RepID=A0AAU7X8I8_9HYPH